jgi:two-component system cell cycle response regulator
MSKREPDKRRARRGGRRTGAGRPPQPRDAGERTSTAVPRLPGSGEKRAFLLVLSGPGLGDIFPLAAGKAVVLGRREDCDVQIRDEGVSRRHARIEVRGESAVVADLGSANGTWIDGRREPEARLTDGARVQVGSQTTLKFIWADALEARYQLKLAEGALVDPLTGLHNRRYFEERLGSELAAARRHRRSLSLLLCDVDHFKSINDEFGHLAGDEVLKTLGLVLRGAVRKEDVLARVGGEEFVVIGRETGLDGAQALGERIRRAVERSRCAWQRHALGVTMSIGATVSLGQRDTAPARRVEREILETADRALYLAKQAGRNRVVALRPGERPAR